MYFFVSVLSMLNHRILMYTISIKSETSFPCKQCAISVSFIERANNIERVVNISKILINEKNKLCRSIHQTRTYRCWKGRARVQSPWKLVKSTQSKKANERQKQGSSTATLQQSATTVAKVWKKLFRPFRPRGHIYIYRHIDTPSHTYT